MFIENIINETENAVLSVRSKQNNLSLSAAMQIVYELFK